MADNTGIAETQKPPDSLDDAQNNSHDYGKYERFKKPSGLGHCFKKVAGAVTTRTAVCGIAAKSILFSPMFLYLLLLIIPFRFQRITRRQGGGSTGVLIIR
jgi:hypothetical protein